MVGFWELCLAVQVRVYAGICMGMGESGVYRSKSKFGSNGGEFCVDLVALVNQLAFFFG